MTGFKINRGTGLAALAVVALGGVTAAIVLNKQPAPSRPVVVAATIPSSPGEAVYVRWCADCHSTPAGPGSQALQRRYKGDAPAVLLDRKDLNPDYVKAVVRNGMSFMPSFRHTEISDSELDLLAQYVSSPAARTAQAKPPAASDEAP